MLTVSLFLVFLGMRPPNLPQVQKPKGYNRAVVETQIKAAKTGIEKSAQTVALGSCVEVVVAPSFYVPPSRPVILNSAISHVSSFPSRAPPAFLS